MFCRKLFENKNIPIVDTNDSRVPLNFLNIVKLEKDQSFEHVVSGYETCIVPATGTIDIEVEGLNFENIDLAHEANGLG